MGDIYYRTSLLRLATEIIEPIILQEWEFCKTHIGVKDVKLVSISNLAAPISIGLFKKSIFVCIPEKFCTVEELPNLRLIFTHELIHIKREDSVTKLFMCICSSICWFNPMLWWGIKKVSQDIELSCDEMVLAYKNKSDCMHYAELVLSSSENIQGFTSCLSANGKTLLYRLKEMVNLSSKKTGYILVSLVAFALVITCGSFGITYEKSSLTFDNLNNNCAIESVSGVFEGEWNEYSCLDSDELISYLSGLELEHIAGDCCTPGIYKMFVRFRWSSGYSDLYMTNKTVCLIDNKNNNCSYDYYYLRATPDWDYICSLLSNNDVTT